MAWRVGLPSWPDPCQRRGGGCYDSGECKSSPTRLILVSLWPRKRIIKQSTFVSVKEMSVLPCSCIFSTFRLRFNTENQRRLGKCHCHMCHLGKQSFPKWRVGISDSFRAENIRENHLKNKYFGGTIESTCVNLLTR